MVSAASIDRSGDPSGDERPAGSVVAGRYRIETLLGTGGMATVYRAKDLATGAQLALKLLRRELSSNPEAATRFRREGELLKGLTHPGIVRVETFGALEDGTLFLAMELLLGETLGQLMRRRGALDPLEVGPILNGACAPLAAAHAQGIVHRDLKPDNVFLARAPGDSEDHFQVKLLDFGISKVFGSERLTQTGELLGTPRYMAPEQLAADDDLDGRVDVYALGVILYEMLAARPPFLGATPSDLIVAILHGKAAPLRAVRSDLPPEIESVVMRTMVRAREARYATPEELAKAFISALGRPSTPGPMRGPAPTARAGMKTAALGAMQSEPPPGRHAPTNEHPAAPTLMNTPAQSGAAPGPPRPVAPEPLVPGTLSGFAPQLAAPAPVVAVVQPVASPPRAAAVAASPPAPSPQPAAPSPLRAPTTSADERGGASAQWSVSAAATTGRHPVDPRESLTLPTRGFGRTGLIVVALLAGALSMGAVIVVLTWLGHHNARTGATAPVVAPVTLTPSQPPVRTPAPGALAPVGRDAPLTIAPPTVAPPTIAPPIIAPPIIAPPTAAPTSANAPGEREELHHRGEHGGTTTHGTTAAAPAARTTPSDTTTAAAPAARTTPDVATATPTAVEPTAPETPSELMMQARRAYASGAPEQCSALVERALSAGAPAIALKLQGDCFRRSGRTDDAIRSYQRFCRLVPDNPAMSEVRALAEGLGASCP